MKSTKKASTLPKKVIFTAIGTVLLSGGYVAAASVYSLWPFQGNSVQTGTSQDSPSQNDQGEIPSNDTADENSAQNSPDNVNSDTKNQDDTNNSPETTEGLTITAAAQNGETVQIRALIAGVWDNGTCTLTLSKESQIVTRSVGLQALSSSSTCQGFDIPTADLTAGTWNIKLVVSHNSSILSAESKVVVQ